MNRFRTRVSLFSQAMKNSITISELQTQIADHADLQLVDVRSAGEYAAGHVPGAINIPLEQLAARRADLKTGPVAILCQSGRRAQMACDQLREIRPDLMKVEGGTQAWAASGHPLVSSTSSAWALERQVRLIAGILVLAGTILATVSAPGWIYLAMFVGAGLTFAGATNVCAMASLLAVMPWNRTKASSCATDVQSREVTA